MTIVFHLQYRLYSYCASCNFFESLFLQIKSDFTGRKSFCDFIYTSWHCHVLLTLKIKVCPATSSNGLRRLINQIQLDHRFWQDTLDLIFISIFQFFSASLQFLHLQTLIYHKSCMFLIHFQIQNHTKAPKKCAIKCQLVVYFFFKST